MQKRQIDQIPVIYSAPIPIGGNALALVGHVGSAVTVIQTHDTPYLRCAIYSNRILRVDIEQSRDPLAGAFWAVTGTFTMPAAATFTDWYQAAIPWANLGDYVCSWPFARIRITNPSGALADPVYFAGFFRNVR